MSLQSPGLLPSHFDSLNVGIMAHDPETAEVVDVNTHLTSLFGYSAAELARMTIEAFSANSGSYTQEVAETRIRAAAAGRPQQFRWRVKRGDGELIWVTVHLSRCRFDGDPYVLAEVHDITTSVATDHRLTLLSRIIRHNLRNDANIIDGYSERIQAAAESPAVTEHLQTLRDRITDLGTLSESVNQIECSVMRDRTELQPVRAASVVTRAVAELADTYPDARISVTETVEMWLRTDEALAYAVRHALENAIAHAEVATPIVDVEITESPNTGRVDIRIEDTCPPIPQMELDAIDESVETSATYHGSGVGLFVMKWCIESLGGEMEIEPDATGNTVSFLLPPVSPPIQ